MFNFYDECGFDYGVSVDHIIGVFRPDLDKTRPGVDPAFDGWRKRQEITLQLAREFWRLCRKRNPRFEPIGVTQGWSPSTTRARPVRPKVLDLLLEYEVLVNGDKDYGDAYREILEEQPFWK